MPIVSKSHISVPFRSLSHAYAKTFRQSIATEASFTSTQSSVREGCGEKERERERESAERERRERERDRERQSLFLFMLTTQRELVQFTALLDIIGIAPSNICPGGWTDVRMFGNEQAHFPFSKSFSPKQRNN